MGGIFLIVYRNSDSKGSFLTFFVSKVGLKALFYKGFISLGETFFKKGFYTLSLGCKI